MRTDGSKSYLPSSAGWNANGKTIEKEGREQGMPEETCFAVVMRQLEQTRAEMIARQERARVAGRSELVDTMQRKIEGYSDAMAILVSFHKLFAGGR